MSDNPNKSSMAVDEEIKKTIESKADLPPALIAVGQRGGINVERWIDDALREAQEDKEIALGRRPPKLIKQPNPAISLMQQRWLTASMNNKRELGPKK